ncbi:MAG TPA: aspartate 1-decarboxylase [Pirellulaceae bacterium]|nr:aspartate 1-decarboxylase [Pirellulaceae bacterium]HMO91568.1 aspartate 1-decarboxylase [Pirellulaceae bacterium]HMP68265.1 aspartate 1-decarboxylase [Pirellulaceae bacterium]
MLRTLLRSKIHRAHVTEADLHYEGSIKIDVDLLTAANIVPLEKVEIYNVTNGNRLATYAIPGAAGSGEICINGAAARLVNAGDTIIICCYGEYHENEIDGHVAKVLIVDSNNRIVNQYEKSPLEMMTN